MPQSEELVSILKGRGKTLALAESCTGGLIAAMVTDVPGASSVFMGGAVTYSNDAKENILGVKHQTLLDNGAVSDPTAREMALGASRVFGTDYAAAVTGIAGPGGATDTKPVGLVFVAVTDGSRTVVQKNNFSGDRQSVRRQTADTAISMLIDLVNGVL